MQLNEAISRRVTELLAERQMNGYQLSSKAGLPRSTISNILNCTYQSMNIRVIHEMCQGMEITLTAFFDSPFFDEINLEP